MSESQTANKTELILSQILAVLSAANQQDNALWGIKQIAHHCGYSDNITRGIVKEPNFPRPRMVPGAGRKWLAEEVKQYFIKLPKGLSNEQR